MNLIRNYRNWRRYRDQGNRLKGRGIPARNLL
jgi:uncharacterized protein YjiS (DUF1127 family)